MARDTEFHDLYGGFWAERWPALHQALLAPETQIARLNLFSTGLKGKEAEHFADRPDFLKRDQVPAGTPSRGPEGLLDYYIMDPGSVYIAEALDVKPGENVLDMCAAPGGKSLVLIEALVGRDATQERMSSEILLNEVSGARRERLKKVVQQYVPRSLRDFVYVTGKDGARFSLTHKNHFDKVLVDAPCSGEGHLLQDKKTFKDWNANWTVKLAQRQYALLTGALESTKPGGEIVFSTCSLSRTENEAVVSRFLERKGDRVHLVPVDVEKFGGENLNGMAYFLPDRVGFGPLFFAKFKKL